MRNHACIFLILFTAGYNTAVGDSSQSCDANAHPELPVTRLKRELLCNYDKYERPVRNYMNVTSIAVILWLKSIDIKEMNYGNSADIHTWTAWRWNDEFLRWDSRNHQGITYLHMNSEQIWIPEVVLQSSTEFQSMEIFLRSGRCTVRSSGSVSCIISSTYSTVCVSDLTRWPFDIHTCELTLTALNDTYSNNVDMAFIGKGYAKLDYVPNREWQLLDVTAKKVKDKDFYFGSDISLTFEFTMKRHSALYISTIFASALVLSIMTAVSFYINPESPARLALCCMNVFIHCLYLQHLQYTVGSTGETCARFVLFYRDSMLLAIMSLVTAVLALRLSSCRGTPPSWCSRTSQWLVDNRVGQVLLAGDLTSTVSATQKQGDEESANVVDNSEDISNKKYPTDKWTFLVDIMDRIIFYVFVTVVFILLIVRVS